MANRKIDRLLSPRQPPSSALARLLGRASQQDAWTDQLRALLPQDLASECRVANVRDQVLTVHINNAAWATRLRFLVPGLLRSLNRLADFTAVSDVRLKVVPLIAESTASTRRRTLRPPDRVSLLELASGVDDAELCSAILRLTAQAGAESAPATERAASAEDRLGK